MPKSLTSSQWARLKACFAAIADLPAEHRAAAIDNACGSDAELRAELESLLAIDDRTSRIREG